MKTRCVRLLLVGAALVCTAANLAAKSNTDNGGYYTARDKEYYLSADEVFFIRPGLEMEILDFEIPSDLQPLVTFSLKDPGGLALDVNGVTTPGEVDVRFMLTYIPQGEENKVSYHPRSDFFRDRNGAVTALGNGVYTYKFNTVLPADYDADATHTLTGVARRDLRDYDLDRYVANVPYHFIPSGSGEPMPRDVVRTATCNNCHNPLAMHGGRYQDVNVCTQCHLPANFDAEENESYSFNVMIHRVHAGVHFPAEINDCEVCHTGGTPTEAFPLVASPNPVPVCDDSRKGMTTLTWGDAGSVEVRVGAADGPVFAASNGAGSQDTGKWVREGTKFYLRDRDSGDTLQKLLVNTTVLGCETNAPGQFRGEAARDHTHWLDHPSRLVCGSCHSDIDFEAGVGHAPMSNDDNCGLCHAPESEVEYDRTVRGAHLPVYKSAQLPGVRFRFIDIVDTAPGQFPTVTFAIGTKYGPINPASLNRLRLTITGPNEDFSFRVQESVGTKAKPAGDNWAYTFETAIPADAEGSYTVAVEGRDNIDVMLHHDEVSTERDPIEATLLAFAVTDATAEPRRMVVDDYNCESCHRNLSLHGNNRRNANYCNTCHRPEFVAVLEPAQSVHFKYMIHSIHMGAERANPYVVIRSRGVFDFSDIHFPGDLRDCETCHVNDSYELPLPDGLLATITPQELLPETPPITAACVACHQSDEARTHALAQTTFFGESCTACHGEGKAFDVEKVHAR